MRLVLQLTDNLKVFHELKGPVFPSASGKRATRRGIVIPPGLPQAPGRGWMARLADFASRMQILSHDERL